MEVRVFVSLVALSSYKTVEGTDSVTSHWLTIVVISIANEPIQACRTCTCTPFVDLPNP